MKAPKLVLLALLLPFVAQAGVVNGGGGKGVVCRDANQKILSVELLDLWEGREIHGRNLAPIQTDVATAVDEALVTLSKSYPVSISSPDCNNDECLLTDLRLTAAEFLSAGPNVRRLRGVKLRETQDSMELAVPQGCAIEQIVNYQPSEGPKVLNQDLFEKMDPTNQAALVVHEAYYKLLRDWAAESNSVRARRATAYVFGGGSFAGGREGRQGLPKGTIVCSSPPPVGKGGRALGTMIIVSKTYDKVFFSVVIGTPLIGVGTVKTPNPESLKRVFEQGCGRDNVGTYSEAFEAFGGPVEFDRTVLLERKCNGKKKEFYASVRAPGSSGLETQSLSCRAE